MLNILVLTPKQLEKWQPPLLRSITKLENGNVAAVVLRTTIGTQPFEAKIDYRVIDAETVSESVLAQLKAADLLPAPAKPKPKAAAKPKRKAAPKKKPAAKKKESK
jgi:hypothetical protein